MAIIKSGHKNQEAHTQNTEEVNGIPGKKYLPNKTKTYFFWSIQGIICVVPSAKWTDLNFLIAHGKGERKYFA